MKTLYAIPTHYCNLLCPHCTIKNQGIKFNHDEFFHQLNSFEGTVILFGGEPTTNKSLMMECIDTGKINSIATNLMILDNELLDVYQNIKYISTSWNPSRFTHHQYDLWLHHLYVCSQHNVKPAVLITLTDDLMDIDYDYFLQIIQSWPSHAISWIKFELLVSESNTPDYYERVDEWLCSIYQKWISSISVKNFDKDVKYYHDCSKIYTLTPDGILHHACPNGIYINKSIPDRCLICDKCDTCRPCILQQYCSYPYKLYELLEVKE